MRATARKLVALGEERNDPRAIGLASTLLGWTSILSDNPESALAAADECIRVGIAPNDRLSASMIKAIATILLGRPRDGLAQLDALIPELERLGSTYLIQLAPRGVALAMLGQISDGIRVVKQQIARCDRIGDQSPGAFARIILAEIYIQILSGKDKPPASVLLKNLWAILYAMVFGARRARTLLQERRGSIS